MDKDKQKKLVYSVIGLGSLFTLALPLYYWAEKLNWKFDNLTILKIFPLLGMLAFSIMWLHFVVAAIKRRLPDAIDYKKYYRKTGDVVLVLILLHPLLLFINGKQEGFTVFDYVGPEKKFFIYLALYGLTVFLLYEIADRMRGSKFVEKNKMLIKILNVSAFVAIFFHGFELGQHVQKGPLHLVWIFYGITTAICIVDSFYWDFKKKQPQISKEK